MLSSHSLPGRLPATEKITAPSICHVNDESELVRFFDPEVSVVVVGNAFSADAGHAAGHSNLAMGEVVVPANAWRLVSRPVPDVVSTFVAHWAELLSEICGCAKVGVRIATLNRAMCPRFHVDLVTVRVVCTLRGEGTHLLDNSEVDRRYLGASTFDRLEHPSLLRRQDAVQVAPAGSVVWLKGELWPQNAGRGAVHRSPDACESAPRVVVTFDALE